MRRDPFVASALERGSGDDPRNAVLRLPIQRLLVVAGDPGRALEHAQAVLAVEPANTEALATARDAARALGDGARAEEYGRLLGALGGAAPAAFAPPAPDAALRAGEHPLDREADDEDLDE